MFARQIFTVCDKPSAIFTNYQLLFLLEYKKNHNSFLYRIL